MEEPMTPGVASFCVFKAHPFISENGMGTTGQCALKARK